MRALHRKISFISMAAFSLANSVAVVSAQPVADRVMSRVRVSEVGECAEVSIEFNFTVQVRSHFPEKHGDHLRVDLQPIDVGRINGAITSREELRPPSSRKAGIQEIQYDGDAPTGPALSIIFNGDRHFKVGQGGDFRSVRLTLSDNPIDKACNVEKPGLREQPVDEVRRDAGKSQSTLHSMPQVIDANAVFALNLLSQQKNIDRASLPNAAVMDQYAAYAVRFEEDGIVWNRLRLGFFKTRAEAEKVKRELGPYYPDAWIVRTSAQERESVYEEWVAARRAQTRNAELIAKSPPVADLPEDAQTAALVADARAAMTAGDLARAIQLLTKATASEENASSPDARELLGVAREKNGQLAHAKAEYEEYLRRYPDSEGAPRVRQRLATLLTAGKEAPESLRDGAPRKNWVTRLTASLSQYYQRDESTVTLEQPDLVPDPDKQVNRNALVSGVDVTASVSNDRFDTTLRFSGANTKDFEQNGRGTYSSISAWFLELADNVSRLTARFGRQSRSTGGVLGRFDGAHVSYDLSDNVRFNVVGGAPVIRSRDLFIDERRKFVGGSVDLSGVIDGLDTSAYFIHQTVDDLVDRQAAGFELRYVDKRRSMYGLLDYDVFYDTINLALFNGTWRLADNTSFNIAFDYRYAPTLMTIDAFQGQGVDTIDQMRAIFGFSDEEIYYLAEERAARMKSGSFNVSHPFNSKLQLNAGVTVSNVSPTNDAGGVPGQPGTGVEKFYNAQILATSIFKDGDLATAGFRYDDMSTASRYVVDLNTRYPVTRNFRVNPRMRFARRESKLVDQTQFTLRPSVRLNYIPSRLFQFELEAGGEWTKTENPLDVERVNGYYVIGGYRLDF